MVMTQSTASRSEKSQIIRITRNLQTQSRGSVYNKDPGPVQGTNQLFLLCLMETNLCREGRRDSVRIVRRKRDFYPSAAQASPVKPGLTVTVVMSEISEIVMIALSVSQSLCL